MSAPKNTYKAEGENVRVSGSVDPEGLDTIVKFGSDGTYSTSDPGIILMLDRLAGTEAVPITKVSSEADDKPKKDA